MLFFHTSFLYTPGANMLSRLRRSQTVPVRPASPAPSSEHDATTSDASSSVLQQLRVLIQPHTTPHNAAFLTDHTLSRYLKSRQNAPSKALSALLETLHWRDLYRPSQLLVEHSASLATEAATGKMYVLPTPDSEGRAILIMRPGLENSQNAASQVRYLVYTLERASRLADNHSSARYVVLVDYFTGNVSFQTSPSLSMMRETATILQRHYPERLHRMLLFSAPKFFAAAFRLLGPFVDPVTRAKVVFFKRGDALNGADVDVDVHALPVEYGGNVTYHFDPVAYLNEDHQH